MTIKELILDAIQKAFVTIKANVVQKTDVVQNATTTDTTKVPSAAVAKSLQDQITTLSTNLPVKVTKINYDVTAAANSYKTVATFNTVAGKSYLICAAAFYASGAPNGLKLLSGSSAIKTVETTSYLDVNFVYPLFSSSAQTLSIQDRRASAGKHSGTVIIFEM